MNAVAGKGHQVFKFSPDGKVLLVLGTAGVAGAGPGVFNRPSDVLVAPNGDVFVADGHGGDSNSRIVKFSRDGRFLATWGRKGAAPGEIDVPHSLAMDSRGRLFVADLNNFRVQAFSQDGTYLFEWKQFGMPGGLFIDRNDMLYVADSLSGSDRHPGWVRGIRAGRCDRRRDHGLHRGPHAGRQPHYRGRRRGGRYRRQRLRRGGAGPDAAEARPAVGSMSPVAGLARHADGVTRCWWPGDDPLYLRYHDERVGNRRSPTTAGCSRRSVSRDSRPA